MEIDRQLRFVISPLIFLYSLAWGAFIDPEQQLLKSLQEILPKNTISKVVSFVLAGGVAVFALGQENGTF